MILLNALSSFDPDGSIANVVVDWGDGNSSFELASNHAYLTQGQYQASITITDNDGASTQDTFSITVLPKPKPPTDGGGIYYATKSDGLPVRVQLNSNLPIVDEDSEIVSYTWDFGNGKTLTLYPHETDPYASIEHYYLTAGTYEVRLTILDSTGLSTTTSRPIEIFDNQRPVPQVTVNQVSGPAPLTVQFSASQTVDQEGDPIRHRWRFGDGTPEVTGLDQAVVSHTFSTPGTYTIRYRAMDDKMGRAEVFFKIIVSDQSQHTPPVPVLLTSPLLGEVSHIVQFDASRSFDLDSSNALTFEWDFGDPSDPINYSNSPSPIHVYRYPGSYFGNLVVKDGLGLKSQIFFVVHAKRNQEDGKMDYAIMRLASDPFGVWLNSGIKTNTAMVDANNYHWFFDQTHYERGRWPTYSFMSAGPHQIRGTAFDVLGNRHDLTKEIDLDSVSPSKDVWLGANPKKAQIGELVSISLEGTEVQSLEGAQMIWDVGEGNLIFAQELNPVSQTYIQPGIKKITLDATTLNGLTYHFVTEVEIYQETALLARFLPTPRVAVAPSAVSFDASISVPGDTPITSYHWQWGDGDRLESSSPTASHTYQTSGNYFPSLIVSDQVGNQSRYSTEVILFEKDTPKDNQAPVAEIVAVTPTEGYAPLIVKLNGYNSLDPDGRILEYVWRSSDGRISIGPEASFEFRTQGDYWIDLEVVDDAGLVGTAKAEISVSPEQVLPTAIISGPYLSGPPGSIFYFDGSLSNSNNGTSLSYVWLLDGREISRSAKCEFELNDRNHHQIELVVTNGSGLSHSAVHTVYVEDPQPPKVVLEIEKNHETVFSSDGVLPQIEPFRLAQGNYNANLIQSYDQDNGAIVNRRLLMDGVPISQGMATHSAWFTLSRAGVHLLTAEVTDNDGLVDTFALQIDVKEDSATGEVENPTKMVLSGITANRSLRVFSGLPMNISFPELTGADVMNARFGEYDVSLTSVEGIVTNVGDLSVPSGNSIALDTIEIVKRMRAISGRFLLTASVVTQDGLVYTAEAQDITIGVGRVSFEIPPNATNLRVFQGSTGIGWSDYVLEDGVLTVEDVPKGLVFAVYTLDGDDMIASEYPEVNPSLAETNSSRTSGSTNEPPPEILSKVSPQLHTESRLFTEEERFEFPEGGACAMPGNLGWVENPYLLAGNTYDVRCYVISDFSGWTAKDWQSWSDWYRKVWLVDMRALLPSAASRVFFEDSLGKRTQVASYSGAGEEFVGKGTSKTNIDLCEGSPVAGGKLLFSFQNTRKSNGRILPINGFHPAEQVNPASTGQFSRPPRVQCFGRTVKSPLPTTKFGNQPTDAVDPNENLKQVHAGNMMGGYFFPVSYNTDTTSRMYAPEQYRAAFQISWPENKYYRVKSFQVKATGEGEGVDLASDTFGVPQAVNEVRFEVDTTKLHGHQYYKGRSHVMLRYEVVFQNLISGLDEKKTGFHTFFATSPAYPELCTDKIIVRDGGKLETFSNYGVRKLLAATVEMGFSSDQKFICGDGSMPFGTGEMTGHEGHKFGSDLDIRTLTNPIADYDQNYGALRLKDAKAYLDWKINCEKQTPTDCANAKPTMAINQFTKWVIGNRDALTKIHSWTRTQQEYSQGVTILFSLGRSNGEGSPWTRWPADYFQMQALILGIWPDGDPITTEKGPIGLCNYRPFGLGPEITGVTDCFLDQINWRTDQKHLSHFHLKVSGGQ